MTKIDKKNNIFESVDGNWTNNVIAWCSMESSESAPGPKTLNTSEANNQIFGYYSLQV